MNRDRRPTSDESRRALAIMLALTVVVAIGVLAIGVLSVTAKSVILVVWIAVMMAVLRRYQV